MLSVSKENLFLSLYSGDKNREAGASLCVCTFCITYKFDGFFEGMNEYQSFSNICFTFWNNCERELRAELRSCSFARHNSAYSLLQSLILLLQSCLYAYFLKYSVTLVKWNIKKLYLLFFMNKIIDLQVKFLWDPAYDKIAWLQLASLVEVMCPAVLKHAQSWHFGMGK